MDERAKEIAARWDGVPSGLDDFELHQTYDDVRWLLAELERLKAERAGLAARLLPPGVLGRVRAAIDEADPAGSLEPSAVICVEDLQELLWRVEGAMAADDEEGDALQRGDDEHTVDAARRVRRERDEARAEVERLRARVAEQESADAQRHLCAHGNNPNDCMECADAQAGAVWG